MQRYGDMIAEAAAAFQSSPARGGGCNAGRTLPTQPLGTPFQSSSARGGGCNVGVGSGVARRSKFQSSPACGGGCNVYCEREGVLHTPVSILTRPWGRVQLGVHVGRCGGLVEVSILTRPWGRVQLERVEQLAQEDGEVSILTRPWGRMQRAFIPTDGYDFYVFQSSPARGGGCNVAWELAEPFVRAVSILTRPWGRVQPSAQCGDGQHRHVSILTRPWGRVQH